MTECGEWTGRAELGKQAWLKMHSMCSPIDSAASRRQLQILRMPEAAVKGRRRLRRSRPLGVATWASSAGLIAAPAQLPFQGSARELSCWVPSGFQLQGGSLATSRDSLGGESLFLLLPSLEVVCAEHIPQMAGCAAPPLCRAVFLLGLSSQ